MSNITYPAKPVAGDGTSSYVEGKTLPATELQGDFDEIANRVNGDLDEDNLKSLTQIPNSKLAEIGGDKVADHADTEAEYATTTTPGDSGSPSRPTDLDEELERLRYRIKSLTGYRASAFYTADTDSNSGISWTEPPIVGPNLLANSGFETFTGATGDPADGWTEANSIVTSVLTTGAPASEGGHKRLFSWTNTVANSGLSQVVEGLKANTKYLFGARYVVSGGTFAMSTAGALAAGNDYQDCTLTDASSGMQQMVIQTDATPTDITVSLLGATTSDSVSVIDSWFYELSDDRPVDVPHIPSQSASVSAEVTNIPATVASGTDWLTQWTDIPGLALSQYIPGPGYRLVYEVDVSWAADLNDHAHFFGFQLEQDNGSATIVDGPHVEVLENSSGGSVANQASKIRLTHVVENPTPGLTYTFTPQATAADSVASGFMNAPRLHPLILVTYLGVDSSGSNVDLQTVSRSRLRVERI